MVRLGSIETRKKLTFREWVEKHGREGRYPVRILFPPQNYPSFSLIFEDIEKNIDVKLTIQKERWREAMKALGIHLKANNIPALEMVVLNGEYGIEYGIAISDNGILEWRGKYWIRAKKEKDDIPF